MPVFAGPNTLSLAAFGLRELECFACAYDFTAWWLREVCVERRTLNQRSKRRPCRVAGAGRRPPEDAGDPKMYMKALEDAQFRSRIPEFHPYVSMTFRFLPKKEQTPIASRGAAHTAL
jgi:hypothetical protein